MKRVSSKVFFMQKTRRKRCPECGFLSTQKWGKRNGHQRYKCNNCGSLFNASRKDITQQNRFVWFEWWILRKQTIMEISQMSGYLEKSLRQWFDDYLKLLVSDIKIREIFIALENLSLYNYAGIKPTIFCHITSSSILIFYDGIWPY